MQNLAKIQLEMDSFNIALTKKTSLLNKSFFPTKTNIVAEKN